MAPKRSASPALQRAPTTAQKAPPAPIEEVAPAATAKPAAQANGAAAPVTAQLHVYKSPDASLLAEYVFFPFYDWIVLYYPKRWVPNYITMFGIMCTLGASLLLLSALPSSIAFDRPFTLIPQPGLMSSARAVAFGALHWPFELLNEYVTPSALLLAAGALNAIYCIADNTDGRQARRTKQTSFIGEYLDHGLDCGTALLSTFLTALCLGATPVMAATAMVAVATVTVGAHILHFSDKIFIWGNRVLSVDEAMVGFAVAPAVAAYLGGPAAAKFALFETGYTVLDLVISLFVLTQLATLAGLLRHNTKNAWDPSFVSIWIVNAAFLALAGTEDQTATASWAPYPVVWTLGYASAASIVAHVPILAQTARIDHQEFWPLAVVFVGVAIFAAHALSGLVFLFSAHTFQIAYNVRFINWIGHQRAAAKSATS